MQLEILFELIELKNMRVLNLAFNHRRCCMINNVDLNGKNQNEILTSVVVKIWLLIDQRFVTANNKTDFRYAFQNKFLLL